MHPTFRTRGTLGAIVAAAACGCSARDALGPLRTWLDPSGQIAFTAFPANAQVVPSVG